VVGPTRDRFWLVYLAALAPILPLALVRPGGALGGWRCRARSRPGSCCWRRRRRGARAPAALPRRRRRTTGLRVLTYNIQQGYADGLRNHRPAGAAAQVDADISACRSRTPNRIAGGNADIVRYFADQLDLYSYYGPKVTGLHVRHRAVVEVSHREPAHVLLYSTGSRRQGSARRSRRADGSSTLAAHLGNGGPVEQRAACARSRSRERHRDGD
jgi:hypothetical protein